jgi:hypothetical protein
MSYLNRVGFICVVSLVAVAAPAAVVVGHPVPIEVAGGAGLTITSLSLPVGDQVVEYCVGSPATYAVDTTLHIGDFLGLPPGEICSIDLILDGPVVISGVGNAGGTFTVTLNIQGIHVIVDPSITVTQSGTTYTSPADALRIGDWDWVTASWLQLGPGVDRNIQIGDDGYLALRNAVRDLSEVRQ